MLQADIFSLLRKDRNQNLYQLPVDTEKYSGLTSHQTVTFCSQCLNILDSVNIYSRGGTPILGHTRDVRPEWVRFPGRKPADGCKFLTKNLLMGHNFDIILPGNGWVFLKIE